MAAPSPPDEPTAPAPPADKPAAADAPGAIVTAALLVIGDEILSGRTQDVNVRALARFLSPYGVDLSEVRVVPDVRDRIIEAVDALRTRYDYCFTTGGIGPTHDDITADSVAAAFKVAIDVREDALALLRRHYAGRGAVRPGQPTEINEGRLRMARIPDGARLILNPVSGAPGFQLENVFVLAGVPGIMRAMLEDVGPRLRQGRPVHANSLRAAGVREGDFAVALEQVAKSRTDVSIGSYPFMEANEGGKIAYGVNLVVRGRDAAEVDATTDEIADLLLNLNVTPEIARLDPGALA